MDPTHFNMTDSYILLRSRNLHLHNKIIMSSISLFMFIVSVCQDGSSGRDSKLYGRDSRSVGRLKNQHRDTIRRSQRRSENRKGQRQGGSLFNLTSLLPCHMAMSDFSRMHIFLFVFHHAILFTLLDIVPHHPSTFALFVHDTFKY